jgi:hypothetical protein|tara:strand:- start:3072 stop:3623 length:552 start_codon:yes stop_codon:yes gene_type:complete
MPLSFFIVTYTQREMQMITNEPLNTKDTQEIIKAIENYAGGNLQAWEFLTQLTEQSSGALKKKFWIIGRWVKVDNMFQENKQGTTLYGKIKKINKKTLTISDVNSNTRIWKVTQDRIEKISYSEYKKANETGKKFRKIEQEEQEEARWEHLFEDGKTCKWGAESGHKISGISCTNDEYVCMNQ